MSGYRLISEAQSDLIGIRHYTLEMWGGLQSKKYLSELQETLDLIAEAPMLGIPRPDIDATVFSFPHASHIIYYLLHEQQLIVIGVLHKRMVPLKHLENRAAP